MKKSAISGFLRCLYGASLKYFWLLLFFLSGEPTPRNPRTHGKTTGLLVHINKVVYRLLEFLRRASAEGDRLNLAPLVHFQVLHQGNEVTVARGDDHGVQFRRHLHGINCETHVPVGLLRTAGEYLEVFGL